MKHFSGDMWIWSIGSVREVGWEDKMKNEAKEMSGFDYKVVCTSYRKFLMWIIICYPLSTKNNNFVYVYLAYKTISHLLYDHQSSLEVN
jgi:hypothetical protein